MTARRTQAWLYPAANLLLALLQVALLWTSGGRDAGVLGLLRLDPLSLLFGTAWILALALASLLQPGKIAPLDWGASLITAGLLLMAYAGNSVVLAAGLALAGVGVWRAHGQSRATMLRVLAAAALVVISSALSGTFRVFAPPAGGVAEAWPLLACVGATLAAILTIIPWPLFRQSGGGSTSLTSIYALAAPYVLVKMLVAARWEPVGAWAIVLLGLLAMLAGAYIVYAVGGIGLILCLGGATIAALGLAPLSPLAAAGAIWLMLAGLLLTLPVRGRLGVVGAVGAVVLLPGLWLATQGALNVGYGVVAALLLPACIFAGLWEDRRVAGKADGTRRWTWVALPAVEAIAGVAAIYPQLAVVWVVRPAVGSLAGGVAALSQVSVDWGVGLALRSAQETLTAALPTTGVAVGTLIVGAALYWLKQIAGRFATRNDADGTGE